MYKTIKMYIHEEFTIDEFIYCVPTNDNSIYYVYVCYKVFLFIIINKN